MDERRYLDIISGRRAGVAAGAMRAGLSLMSPGYRAAIGVRNRLYDLGAKRVHRVDVPVVSVGNITTGGTGKTPMVAWLAQWFVSQGRRPCLISRGYRSVDETGNDERRVLQQLCPTVPHEQNRDRVAAARTALERHSPNVVILDDGFQHRRLGRDVDLVLIDALCPWGYGQCLPRGLLREPPSSLKRVDAVILTRADQIDASRRSALHDEIAQFTDAPVVEVAFRPQQLLSLTGETAELSSLNGQQLAAFCGIGNPDAFGRTLSDAGHPDLVIEAFPDHHHYTSADLQRVINAVHERKCTALLTTQKDLVKLRSEWLDDVPVWAVVIGAQIITGKDELLRLLKGV